jgi:hypothetical protein
MKNLIKISLALMSLCLLTACASTQNYEQTLSQWQGESVQQLINVWGYPDAGIKLPNGNSVYMYTRQQTYISPSTPAMTPTLINVPGSPMAVTSYNGEFVGGQTVSLYCRTWFEVNPKGMIVNYRFQGNNCVASRKNHWTPAG